MPGHLLPVPPYHLWDNFPTDFVSFIFPAFQISPLVFSSAKISGKSEFHDHTNLLSYGWCVFWFTLGARLNVIFYPHNHTWIILQKNLDQSQWSLKICIWSKKAWFLLQSNKAVASKHAGLNSKSVDQKPQKKKNLYQCVSVRCHLFQIEETVKIWVVRLVLVFQKHDWTRKYTCFRSLAKPFFLFAITLVSNSNSHLVSWNWHFQNVSSLYPHCRDDRWCIWRVGYFSWKNLWHPWWRWKRMFKGTEGSGTMEKIEISAACRIQFTASLLKGQWVHIGLLSSRVAFEADIP